MTGIDVSKASIEETAKLKRKHGLHNLDLAQLPIERAGELGASFDYIVCTGVLHHLPDPDAGLRALRECSRRRRHASDGLRALRPRRHLHAAGLLPPARHRHQHEAEIRQLAASLVMLPPDHPLMPLLRKVPGLRNPAGLADALLNPRTAPIRYRSCSICLQQRISHSGAGCARRHTFQIAARFLNRRTRKGSSSYRKPSSSPPSNCSGGQWSSTAS